MQLGRLLDPSVKIGSHADDVIWAERSGVSAEIPTEAHVPLRIIFEGIALVRQGLLECVIQIT